MNENKTYKNKKHKIKLKNLINMKNSNFKIKIKTENRIKFSRNKI